MQQVNEKLQHKLKILKKQLEDAEEIATVNMNKLRKVQFDLENAEERANQSESSHNKLHSRITMSHGRMNSPQVTFCDNLHLEMFDKCR